MIAEVTEQTLPLKMNEVYCSFDLALRRSCAVFVLITSCLVATGFGQKGYTIAEIQGNKNLSALDSEIVQVSGIVTGRTRTGFFIQTPDDEVDKDPNTSEGVFVFTKDDPPPDAAMGNFVSLTGKVDEFKLRSDPNTLTLTEISFFKGRDNLKVISRDNPLPQPVILNTADFKLNAIDQLEKYEGMRVQAKELVVCAPTDGRVDIKTASSQSDGVFFGVLKGIARPFREPGLDVFSYIFAGEKNGSR